MKLIEKKVLTNDMFEPVVRITLDLSIEDAQTAKLAISQGVLSEDDYKKALGQELLRLLTQELPNPIK